MRRRIGGPILLVVLGAGWLVGCGDAPPAPSAPAIATLAVTVTVRPSDTAGLPPASNSATTLPQPPTAIAAQPPTAPAAQPRSTPAAQPPTVSAAPPSATTPGLSTVPPASATTAAAPAPAAPPTQTSLATEAPVAPEQNPAGDISDSQVFVTYRSAEGGYQVDVPEGWARTVAGPAVTFADKLNGVQVSLAAASGAPSSAEARATEVPALERTGRAVQVTGVRDVTLPSGSAVVVEYTSNSDPNAVTGKQVRLENVSYLFFHNGKLATLHLWAPAGADNVDQWNRMAGSFRWP